MSVDESKSKKANKDPEELSSTGTSQRRDLTLLPASGNLYKFIFQSDSPEDVIKTFPAQSIYMAIQQSGLHSAAEIVEAASIEQCRLLYDFDCWNHDQFREESFWDWLSLPDSTEDMSLLQKFLKFVDLKLVALMIDRYTDIVVLEEPTEQPSTPGYYTPDKGYTWILITAEDADQNFLMGRLLALIFETSHELFYQIMSIPAVATQSVLEEESYQDKTKRLEGVGIPDREYAHSIHRPISREKAAAALKEQLTSKTIEDIQAVTPFVYDTMTVRPLATVLNELTSIEGFQREFTLIMNTAIVLWSVPFHEITEIQKLINTVKGMLNIGLEVGSEVSGRPPAEVSSTLGWQKVYQLGLGEVDALKKKAYSLTSPSEDSADLIAQTIVEGLTRPLPEMPLFFRADGSFAEVDGKLESGTKPVEYLKEVAALMKHLEDL